MTDHSIPPEQETAKSNLRKLLFAVLALCCLTPLISAPLALLLGILTTQAIGNPFSALMQRYKVTQRLLQYSVVGLGFGMNIYSAAEAGKQGVLFTVVTITGTLLLGSVAGRLLGMDKKITSLVSSGTAICGGSAIAAIAPVIKASDQQISVALGTVFILNAIALFIFPRIGLLLEMSDIQFGLWSAIAIHDTSSVVGAATRFSSFPEHSEQALQVATTVKLARALWIIPLAFIMAVFYREGKQKIKIPYFIGFFILAMLINTYVPAVNAWSGILVGIAKAGLILSLFFIGAGLSLKTIRSVGFRPMLLAVLLWAVISVSSLYVILNTVV